MSALARFLKFLVVVAAGVGAWVGYEQLVVAADEPSVAAADLSSGAPWPADLDASVAPWDSYAASFLNASGDTAVRTAFDAETGRAQASIAASDGSWIDEIEADATATYVSVDDKPWRPADSTEPLSVRSARNMAFALEPAMLAELLPETVWPYASLVADEASIDGRRVSIVVDNVTFAARQPTEAARWRAGPFIPQTRDAVVFTMLFDDMGRMVLFSDDHHGSVMRWTELTTPLVLQSPLGN